jgi:uncharacterized membrane-anchored protein
MNRLVIASVWIGLQIFYLCGWTAFEASRLLPGVGESIVVRTLPVDPRDLLRGQFMRFRYGFSRAPGTISAGANEPVWVVLRPEQPNDQGIYEPVAYSLSRPTTTRPGDVVIQGTAKGNGLLEFGIEKYFVPEGTETPDARDITVRLRIGIDHRPRIETVYLWGSPWP